MYYGGDLAHALVASVLRFVLILNVLALGLCSRVRCREQPVLPSTSSSAAADCGVPLAVAGLDLLDHAEHELYLACALAVTALLHPDRVRAHARRLLLPAQPLDAGCTAWLV